MIRSALRSHLSTVKTARCATAPALACKRRSLASGSSSSPADNADARAFNDLFRRVYPLLTKYMNEDQPASQRLGTPAVRANVVNYLPPSELRAKLPLSLPEVGRQSVEGVISTIRAALQYSVRTISPRFWDKLYVGTDPIGQVGELLTTLLNANIHTYASAPAFILMELELVKRMGQLAGFEGEFDGLFNPGGSMSNYMSMMLARQRKFPHVKKQGYKPSDKPVMFTSTHSHYSLKLGAITMGLGTDSVILVPCDEHGHMRPDELERLVKESIAKGCIPFYVNATSGTTVLGSFDPLPEIADVCKRHALFFHVDASWGGGVLMSDKHRHLMRGSHLADSIAWNPHKMMSLPLQCSLLLVKEKGLLQKTNSLSADYLFHNHEAKEYDVGEKTIQCGRKVDSLKLLLSWQYHGRKGFEAMIDSFFDNARFFADLVKKDKRFVLVREPESLNVCFFFLPPSIRNSARITSDNLLGKTPLDKSVHSTLDKATQEIYKRMQAAGTMLVNFNPLLDCGLPRFFRIIVSNPRSTRDDLAFVLDEIARLGADL